MSVVLSDIAGTIVEGNPWRALRHWDKITRAQLWSSYAKVIPPYWASKVGLLDETRFRRVFLHEMAALLKGQPRAELDALFRQMAETFVAHHARPGVLAALHEHQQQGCTVLLVTTMFTPMAEAFARAAKLDGGVGTALAFEGDVCAGRVDGDICTGANKPAFAQRWLRAHGQPDALLDAYAYTDSYGDLPLLRAVGHPVAVYPEAKLRAEAQAQGWAVHES